MFIPYFGYSFGLGFLVLCVFGILQWLHIPAGNLADWLIGIASFWWLIAIATIPWNIYFEAREVLVEANTSQEKGLTVEPQKTSYVKKLVRWSLIVAIALHFLSAVTLYILAAAGISVVGYVSSVATLLLTALRPAIRGYQYLAARLAMIRREIKYPREDVLELRQRFTIIEEQIRNLTSKTDLKQANSPLSQIKSDTQENRHNLNKLRATLEQLEARNEVEHQRLLRESQSAIAQLTEDSQVLNHVREIIRFFKAA
ncbi:MAG: hypothetical protein WA865_11430 [Spirulinaceae cyanobacterium]